MTKHSVGRQAWLPRLSAIALASSALLQATGALADFAPSPESPYQPHRPVPLHREDEDVREQEGAAWSEPAWQKQPSTLRFHVGPAVLLRPVSPGLFTALDLGQGAVGGRISAAWLRAESDDGLSAYTAELWIDFRHRYTLHPVLGAGASWLRGGAVGEHDSAGAGVLRGAIEYELPIADADARVALSASAYVPAIGTERTRPWATFALTLGAGF